MGQAAPQNGRAEAALLEGFTPRTLAESLAHLDLEAAQLGAIAAMIAVGGGCDVFAAEQEGARSEADTRSCLVDGPRRSIALGTEGRRHLRRRR